MTSDERESPPNNRERRSKIYNQSETLSLIDRNELLKNNEERFFLRDNFFYSYLLIFLFFFFLRIILAKNKYLLPVPFLPRFLFHREL